MQTQIAIDKFRLVAIETEELIKFRPNYWSLSKNKK